MPSQVLFLCTGNYYRSRFAEELFNHLAREKKLDAVAISRGLRIDRTGLNSGPSSPHTLAACKTRGIDAQQLSRMPLDLTYGDLRQSHLVVALKEAEHRPMLDAKFPGWSAKTIFWHVHDLDAATPDQAIAEIESHVRQLIDQLPKVSQ
jgi:protein-tyrosine phosphatase